MDLYKAMYRVLLEGQAYLYSMFRSMSQEKDTGKLPTEQDQQDWMDEWKIEAADELKELMLEE